MPLAGGRNIPKQATTSPGGRPLNPDTVRIMGMPGGSDYLAGLGPAPAGIGPYTPPAPIIHGSALPGPVGSMGSAAIRQSYPQGFGSLFNAWNALGYQPPQGSGLEQWYQNGLWGGGMGGVANPYNLTGAANTSRNATAPTNTMQPWQWGGAYAPILGQPTPAPAPAAPSYGSMGIQRGWR